MPLTPDEAIVLIILAIAAWTAVAIVTWRER